MVCEQGNARASKVDVPFPVHGGGVEERLAYNVFEMIMAIRNMYDVSSYLCAVT